MPPSPTAMTLTRLASTLTVTLPSKDEKFFKVYQPTAGDELHPPDDGYIGDKWTEDGTLLVVDEITQDTKAWWNMACGRVLGMLNGMLIEYDPSTLAPLGLVVGADELVGKKIAVINSGLEECMIDDGENQYWYGGCRM